MPFVRTTAVRKGISPEQKRAVVDGIRRALVDGIGMPQKWGQQENYLRKDERLWISEYFIGLDFVAERK